MLQGWADDEGDSDEDGEDDRTFFGMGDDDDQKQVFLLVFTSFPVYTVRYSFQSAATDAFELSSERRSLFQPSMLEDLVIAQGMNPSW